MMQSVIAHWKTRVGGHEERVYKDKNSGIR